MFEHMDRGIVHHLLHFPIFLFHVATAHQVFSRTRQKNRTIQFGWRGYEQRSPRICTREKRFCIFLDNVLPVRTKTPFMESSCILHLSLRFLFPLSGLKRSCCSMYGRRKNRQSGTTHCLSSSLRHSLPPMLRRLFPGERLAPIPDAEQERQPALPRQSRCRMETMQSCRTCHSRGSR